MTKFVILAAPRTGSYLLVDLLKQHKGVVCYGEIYKESVVEITAEYRDRVGADMRDVQQRDADPIGFYNKLYGLTPDDITGFKIFRTHGSPLIRALLLDHSVKKVFLSRNPVQSFVSLKMAQVTGKWINKNDPTGTRVQKVRVNVCDLVSHITGQKSWFDFCRTICRFHRSHFMLVDYADLSDPATLQRLADFLGMGDWNEGIQPGVFKQITKDYAEIVANWPRIEQFMRSFGVGINDRFVEFSDRFSTTRPADLVYVPDMPRPQSGQVAA